MWACMGEPTPNQRLITVATVSDGRGVHHNVVVEVKCELGRGQHHVWLHPIN